MNTQKIITYTQEQLDIFAWFAMTLLTGFKNLVVIARAGVGKTSTIIESFKHVPGQSTRILYGVFNKKNQVEAEGKITDRRVTVKTWHSVGYGIIARNWGRIKADAYAEWNRATTVCTEPEFLSKDKKYLVAMVASLVSCAKNYYIGVPELPELVKLANMKGIQANKQDTANGWTIDKLAGIGRQVMELSKKPSREISFDDMVWLPVTLGIVQPEYDLVCGDEAQDLNLLQLTMLTSIVKPNGRICLVGDDKQAIYGFRGAVADGLNTFKEKLGATTLKLTSTFRCPKLIVNKAREYAEDYVAHDSNIDGEVLNCTDEKMVELVKVKDFILSRTNAPLMRHCLALIRKGKTAKIEGKDIARNLISVIEQLQANNINEFAEKLDAWAQARIAKATGRNADSIIEMVNDQRETLNVLSQDGTVKSIDDMVFKINSMFQDSESQFAKPAIILSTVHKAKGLEAKNVFLLQETFKGGKAKTPEDIQQERNVYYVALTRTQEKLYLVSSV